MEKEDQNPKQGRETKSHVWDCDSSLYDSFELKSFKRQLDSAIASRTLSMPRLQDVAPLPAAANPPPSTRSSFKFTRSFHKLLRSIFQRKSVKNTRVRIDDQCSENGFYVIYPSRGGALPKIPEAWEEGVDSVGVSPEYDSLVRRSVSERFTSSTAAAAVLGVSYG